MEVFGAKGANLAPSWSPKTLQNRGREAKKSLLKNDTFSTSILEGFRLRFGRVFERFLNPKMNAFGENAFFAKTWKISILLRENQYFQGFEDNKNAKTMVTNLGKHRCFLGLRFWRHFGRVLWGFWKAKNLDFRTFFDAFSKQIVYASRIPPRPTRGWRLGN